MEKSELQISIERIFRKDEKFSRRLERSVQDIEINTGMSEQEILDFLSFGASEELNKLDLNYDWNRFTSEISKKLRGGHS